MDNRLQRLRDVSMGMRAVLELEQISEPNVSLLYDIMMMYLQETYTTEEIEDMAAEIGDDFTIILQRILAEYDTGAITSNRSTELN